MRLTFEQFKELAEITELPDSKGISTGTFDNCIDKIFSRVYLVSEIVAYEFADKYHDQDYDEYFYDAGFKSVIETCWFDALSADSTKKMIDVLSSIYEETGMLFIMDSGGQGVAIIPNSECDWEYLHPLNEFISF